MKCRSFELAESRTARTGLVIQTPLNSNAVQVGEAGSSRRSRSRSSSFRVLESEVGVRSFSSPTPGTNSRHSRLCKFEIFDKVKTSKFTRSPVSNPRVSKTADRPNFIRKTPTLEPTKTNRELTGTPTYEKHAPKTVSLHKPRKSRIFKTNRVPPVRLAFLKKEKWPQIPYSKNLLGTVPMLPTPA